ncbi:putative copper resistance protein D [Microlunatus sagamiharensis]|uniref:Putative copper resistance protein D n=1 Tax=Microlunatus sagamiharensis TaxID=546874 RepID=A0A1H2NDI1_9ACTN|nr:cytochrome c oxidase assembly protein [Microlunatus sagamiharensis]SDV03424.1 putative copper resistance protein D [Microlunatus sagamiharensis]
MATTTAARVERREQDRPTSGRLVVVTAGAVAVVVSLVLLGVTGSLAAPGGGLLDPGALTRYGLPAARAVHDLAASATVGLLVLAAFFVAPAAGKSVDSLAGPRRTMVRAATVASLVWAGAGLVVLVLTAADVAGFSPTASGFSVVLFSFTAQLELGRALLVSLLLVLLVAVLCTLATRVVAVAWAAAFSLLAVLPLSLVGHAAGSDDHMNAVDSLAIHLVGAVLWVGGLVALVLVGRRLGDQQEAVVRRYSMLAGACFVLVAVSGVVNAALRVGSVANLATPYGLLVVAKVVALGLLGVAGYLHRRRAIPRLGTDRSAFARIAAVELVVMGATVGLAVALSRSAPPVPETAEASGTDRVASLLGYPEPPPFTVGRYLTAFYPELLWLVVALLMVGLYAAGAVKLMRRGDRWPVQRTLFWTLGCVALVYVTSGGPGVYGRLGFSLHMVQHMALMVLVPFLLVFGAPVTLALRALDARRDRSFGPREVLLRLVHAKVLTFLGNPVVAAVLFTGGLTVFYYTPLFGLALATHTGHVLMTAHFLLTGYLFIWALVGIDPGPKRPPYPFRLLILLVTLAFHAFFGIALMSGSALLAPEWWAALGRTDTTALLADQQRGGAIAWGAGDLPSLALGVALLAGWLRSDRQTSKRLDRQADRDDDAELKAYNARLSAMSGQAGTPQRKPEQ